MERVVAISTRSEELWERRLCKQHSGALPAADAPSGSACPPAAASAPFTCGAPLLGSPGGSAASTAAACVTSSPSTVSAASACNPGAPVRRLFAFRRTVCRGTGTGSCQPKAGKLRQAQNFTWLRLHKVCTGVTTLCGHHALTSCPHLSCRGFRHATKDTSASAASVSVQPVVKCITTNCSCLTPAAHDSRHPWHGNARARGHWRLQAQQLSLPQALLALRSAQLCGSLPHAPHHRHPRPPRARPGPNAYASATCGVVHPPQALPQQSWLPLAQTAALHHHHLGPNGCWRACGGRLDGGPAAHPPALPSSCCSPNQKSPFHSEQPQSAGARPVAPAGGTQKKTHPHPARTGALVERRSMQCRPST